MHYISEILKREQVPGVNVRMIYCDPALADLILALNTHNRSIMPSVVEKYTQEILNGEWVANSAGIGIDEKGVMTDGQHRLAAIIKSGCTVPLLICWNLPAMAQEKTDRHKSRTLAQVFQLAGISNSRVEVTIASFLARKVHNASSVADSHVKDALHAHKEAIAAVLGLTDRGNWKGVGVGGFAAMVLGFELAPQATTDFIIRAREPIELTHDDPRYRFHKLTTEGIVSSRNFGSAVQYMMFERTAYCLNAWFAGQKITRILSAKEVMLPAAVPHA